MPIHWAASGGHTDIVRFLLDLGVPVDNKDDVSFLKVCCVRKIHFNLVLIYAHPLIHECPFTILLFLLDLELHPSNLVTHECR